MKQLEKNLEIKTNEISIEQINQMRKYNEQIKLEELLLDQMQLTIHQIEFYIPLLVLS